MLPRLARKTLALSRLTGDRRRGPEKRNWRSTAGGQDRIHLLEKELEKIGREGTEAAKRTKSGLPILSIIGYTNAGKSTLFNLLTQSRFLVEDKLFATLDPATRKLRYPELGTGS